jgi:N-acetyl-alpha-D-muramate 1-phosphate uridylyltransferase
MRAMILAAGRGLRMAHLTAETPKPLLRVCGHYLIEFAIHALRKAGIQDIVINVSYLREQIKSALGDGKQYDVRLHYSEEPDALETGGGILQALPLLGKGPFIVLSGDLITEYPLENLIHCPKKLAHLVLVNNPDFHPQGDFCLQGDRVLKTGGQKLTFSNMGVYHPDLFAHCQPGRFRLGDLLKEAVEKGQVTGEHYQGVWYNVGTPQQLDAVDVRKQLSLKK